MGFEVVDLNFAVIFKEGSDFAKVELLSGVDVAELAMDGFVATKKKKAISFIMKSRNQDIFNTLHSHTLQFFCF